LHAQQPARQQTLSDIYRNSGDIELQNKVAPFKVFDNLYHVGPGYVDAWLIPTSAGIIMIDTAEEPFVDHVINNIRTLGFDLKDVIGSDSGTRYRIRHGRMINIDQLDSAGKKVCMWCVVPEGNLAASDCMLAQKVALETFETKALAIANQRPS
jgi:hypothetical protein